MGGKMASLNRCDFIGRLGATPEVKYTASGTAVASCSIACSEKFKNKSGETQEKTEWINLVFWGKLAEIVGEYLEKGKEIYVSGRMQTEKYTDKDNVVRYATKINCDKMQMLGGKGDGGSRSSGEQSGGQENHGSGGSGGYSEPSFNPEDDIPF
jgi:single-strand DNA-binding protein